MDHTNRLSSLLSVEYRKGKTFDPSRHDFHSYPEELGWHLDEEKDYSLTSEDQKTGHTPRVRIDQLLQSWLFFGLIMTVVRIDEQFVEKNDAEYVKDILEDGYVKQGLFLERTDASAPFFIHINELLEVLAVWDRTEQKRRRDEDEGEAGRGIAGLKIRMFRAEVALGKARRVIRKNCSFVEDEKPKDVYTTVDDELALTLQILGEALTNAKNNIMRNAGLSPGADEEGGWGIPRFIVKKMTEMGWCPKVQRALRGQFSGNATALLRIYMTHQTSKDKEHLSQHHHCHPHECPEKAKMDAKGKSSYVTTHCRCENPDACTSMFGPNTDEVINVLRSDQIPLVTLRKTSEGCFDVTVTSSQFKQKYATISHVWADGFGNEEDNKLRACQLEFLANLLHQAEAGPDGKSNDPSKYLSRDTIPFWMDTLVVPVDSETIDLRREMRKKAIRQIHEVYVKASYTIVIDNHIMGTRPNAKFEDVAIRILASGWMRRLWTLQEACFSGKLMFTVGKNNVRNIEGLKEQYTNENKPRDIAVEATAKVFFDLMGADQVARLYNSSTNHALVASVWRATQWRVSGGSLESE
jgi:hypothetical protein